MITKVKGIEVTVFGTIIIIQKQKNLVKEVHILLRKNSLKIFQINPIHISILISVIGDYKVDTVDCDRMILINPFEVSDTSEIYFLFKDPRVSHLVLLLIFLIILDYID